MKQIESKKQPVSLYSVEHGQGIPIILLHGFPFNHSIWNNLVPSLAVRARLICPDLRGHGKSSTPEDSFQMEDLAGDVHELMVNRSIDQAILVGHSMGGYVSLAFLESFPEKCLGLILVASHASADTGEKREGRFATISKLENQDLAGVADSMTKILSDSHEIQQDLRSMILSTPIPSLIGCLRGMAERPDRSGLVKMLKIPILIIAGENDKILPVESAKKLSAQAKNARLVVIPGAGHMPMLEKPEQMIQPIDEFFAQFQ